MRPGLLSLLQHPRRSQIAPTPDEKQSRPSYSRSKEIHNPQQICKNLLENTEKSSNYFFY